MLSCSCGEMYLLLLANLVMFSLKVKHDRLGKDELVGWACIRLDRCMEGFRFVRLLNSHGVESQGVLLVKISKILT